MRVVTIAGVLMAVLFGILFLLSFGIIAYAFYCIIRQWSAQKAADDNSPLETSIARMVTKRTQVSGYAQPDMASSASTSYYCTFEFTDGARREFLVAASEFGLLAEGDEGPVTFQGSRYKGFQREGAPTSHRTSVS